MQATANGKGKHVFITEEQIINALAFTIAPTLLGELSKDKKTPEHFEFTPCCDENRKFIGFAVEKKLSDDLHKQQGKALKK